MVGALSRLAINGNRIGGLARWAWDELKLAYPCSNILLNNIAQAIEMIFSVERALHIVENLIETGIRPEPPISYRVRACEGSAATEVPRGILFYSYRMDELGRIAAADVITPTAQNLDNAEDQMRAVLNRGLKEGVDDSSLQERLAVVARAYDPCISCSVHVVRV